MKKEFVMRGQTASGETEVLNFSGYKPGYAYRMTEFLIYPYNPTSDRRSYASVTAGKTAVDPANSVDFNNEGLIATAMDVFNAAAQDGRIALSIVNDTFLITQNLILMVSAQVSSEPINWQCRFVAEKMSGPEEAATNYKQYLISDGS